MAIAFPEFPDGNTILENIDKNLTSDSQIVTSTMVIHGRRSSRTITAKSWTEGSSKSFSEYLAPAREKGTKMLKLDDQLWMYTSQSDRIIKISGHMLRQSVMGSDLSYEDMMENPRLAVLYQADVIADTVLLERPCYILSLKAKSDGVTYAERKLWVDKERMIALREERFAKSGKLLKVIEVTEIMMVDTRWYPKRVLFRDNLQKGQGTEFIIDEIAFNAEIPANIFSKAILRK